MARSAILFPPTPGVDPSPMTEANSWTPLKTLTDLLALGVFQRNIWVGGGQNEGYSGEVTGTFDVEPWIPFGIDNRNTSQISTFLNTNGGTLVCQWRFLVRVSNAAINVTPVIYNISATANATISGQAACSATSDAYSGTDQQQTIVLTIPSNALNFFRPKITLAGTVAAGYQYWVTAVADLFIET